MPSTPVKPVVWLVDSLQALKSFPAAVQDEVGYALFLAQRGDKHVSAKLLKGLGSRVLEVVSDHRGDTFRAVYTVRLADRVFVLHAFPEEARTGSGDAAGGCRADQAPSEAGRRDQRREE